MKERTLFRMEPHAAPVSVVDRASSLVDPGFGRVFTDHMVLINYDETRGWHSPRVTARVPIALDPAAAVFHYAQEIFEGMKAFRLADGTPALFRPEANAARFHASAVRMAMAPLPEAMFLDSVRALVRIDADWIPESEGASLYLRPFMIASEAFLGVKPSAEYLYVVIASSVGAYFKSGASAITVWVSRDVTRAAPGGTGAAKCGGNYAASLTALGAASAKGCDQVVFLDAVERRWVEELGGMNTFFVFDDGSIITPPLSGTILPGITRDAIMILAREQGLTVREEPYAIDDWARDAASGRLRECFACGTAAVITPIGHVRDGDGGFAIGSGGPGQLTQSLRAQLVAIQRGLVPDRHGWIQRIEA